MHRLWDNMVSLEKPTKIVKDMKYSNMYRLQWKDRVQSEDFYNLTRANDILRNYLEYAKNTVARVPRKAAGKTLPLQTYIGTRMRKIASKTGNLDYLKLPPKRINWKIVARPSGAKLSSLQDHDIIFDKTDLRIRKIDTNDCYSQSEENLATFDAINEFRKERGLT